MAIHLINPLWDASGGSEWRTLSLFQLLGQKEEVDVWTEYTPDPLLLGRYPIKQMLQLQNHPRGGTLVFVGCYFDIGRWVAFAHPERVILVYNVVAPDSLEDRLRQLSGFGIDDVELVFSSEIAAAHANGRTGRVEPSPMEMERFAGDRLYGKRFVLGRHSRDVVWKHHPEDPLLYRHLEQEGVEGRIMGGTTLADLMHGTSFELLPANSEDAAKYLTSIDCFYYRTDRRWTESYGRVVVEAMASGLPCVLEARHGYASLIEHGRNGFLFDTAAQARDQILKLYRDAALRAEVGIAARESITSHYESATAETLRFYIGN